MDFETLRATIAYMHDDASRTPGCERLARALDEVRREIDACERSRAETPASSVVSARFVPFRS